MSDTKLPVTSEELAAFIAEVNEEAKHSERASILISAGMLDEMLKRALTWFMVEDKISRKMLDVGGPLGTFSSRIDACFALGLISKSQWKGMHQIREVRNTFAHKLRGQIDRGSVLDKVSALAHALAAEGKVKPEQIAELRDDSIRWQINACTAIFMQDVLQLFAKKNRRKQVT